MPSTVKKTFSKISFELRKEIIAIMDDRIKEIFGYRERFGDLKI